jgi:hypothetical protein
MRRQILTAAALGVAALAAAPAAMAAPSDNISGCQLSGNASFTKPLQGSTSVSTDYSFSGTLSNCHSSSSSAPTTGTISAGTSYGLPATSLNGTCANGVTSGVAWVQWNDGKNTIVSYSTNSVTAAVELAGTVIQSVQHDTGKKDQFGHEIFETISTNEPATPVGDDAGGVLAFQPPDPTACGPTGAGVSTAGISGVIATGYESDTPVPLPWPPPPPPAAAKAHHAHAHHARAHVRAV